MDPALIIRAAYLYVLAAAAETLNGIPRTMFSNRRLGVRKAKGVSLASALLLRLATMKTHAYKKYTGKSG